MSLKDIRPECSDIAGLLQPFVDGEVGSDDQEKVAEHLEGCAGCRAAVSEQAWVRSMLHSLPRERAPQAVRARVLLALDEVDREATKEAAASSTPPPRGLWQRLRDLGKGGLVMLPAGAVALGLFVVARQAPAPDAAADAVAPGLSPSIGGALVGGTDPARRIDPDAALLERLSSLQPSLGFSPQLPGPRTAATGQGTPQVELVAADLDESGPAERPALRLRYELRDGGRPTGWNVVDRQLGPSASWAQGGDPLRTVSGLLYRQRRGAAGEPIVWFEVRGVVHEVMLVPAPGRAAAGDATPPDHTPLVHYAEMLHAR